MDAVNDIYGRFKDYGIPPAKNGDYAFLLHIIRSLKSKGKGAVILPHGVLFRGNAEAEIRTNIIRRGYIKGIIGLPANLFYGTGIPACIIVLDKENAENRKGIFMIDAGKCYEKDGNKNRLREQDIHKIVDVFNKQIEIEKYSRMVPVTEIETNEFNLNIPRYIDSQEAEDIQDIEAHLLGGIPNTDIDALHPYWEVYPTMRKTLFTEGSRARYSKLLIAHDEVKAAIFSHPKFTDYSNKVDAVFGQWKGKHIAKLKGITADDKPRKLIHEISEDILQAFSNVKLIDKYDVYQHLMVYWADTMQDDVYALVDDGWDGRLIPKELIIATYFAAEQKDIEAIEAACDAITRQMEEMEEEHSGEEGLISDAQNDTGKITKASVQKRLKEIQKEKESVDELKVLQDYLKLAEQEAETGRKIKEAKAALEKMVSAKYQTLTETEIKTLVVENKWMAAKERDDRTEMARNSHRLTSRIKELAKRYEAPLPVLTTEVETLEQKVREHLRKMGFRCK